MNKKFLALIGILFASLIVITGCTININTTDKTDTNTPTNIENTKPASTVNTPVVNTPVEPVKPIATNTPEPAKPKVDNPPTPITSLVDCGSDTKCLNQRATSCLKTKYLYVKNIESADVPGAVTTSTIQYEITGMNGSQCEFFHGMMNFHATATEAAIQQLMKMENKTHAEVEQEIKEANKQLATDFDSSIHQYCQTSSGKNIADHIARIIAGTEKIVANNDKTTYGTNIFCTQR